jgi:hypothetical protein
MYIYKHDLGFWIYKEIDWLKFYLTKDQSRKMDKKSSKIFYNMEDAISAFILIKVHDRKKSN